MSGINKIYSNEIGMSFFWKKETTNTIPKIQIVFKDMGFLLTINELKDFSEACIITKNAPCCRECNHTESCKSLLLRTPSSKIDLAINKEELHQLHELISGTIFRIDLKNWISNLCRN